MNRMLLVGFVAAIVLAGIWLWSGTTETEAKLAVPPGTAQAPPDAFAPGELTYEAPRYTKTPSPGDRPRLVELPNGEFVPALNGVRGAPRMDWPRSRPYSPIIGRVRTTHLEWYVHADGTRSTTQMSFRTDLGRFDAITTVANPAPVGQIPPDEKSVAR